jgi:hypothetical protein
MAWECGIRTRLYHLDTEAGLPSHKRMRSQPFRMICNWAVYHHTSTYNIRFSAIKIASMGCVTYSLFTTLASLARQVHTGLPVCGC